MKAFFAVLFIGSMALGQGQSVAAAQKKGQEEKPNLVEVVCRIKAKEAAAHAFRSCMLDDKSAQLQELKKTAAKRIQKRKELKAEKTQPEKVVEKTEIFKDKETTVEVQTDKELEAALEQVQKPVKKERLKPAMLVEDDTDLPEPTTLEEDPE